MRDMRRGACADRCSLARVPLAGSRLDDLFDPEMGIRKRRKQRSLRPNMLSWLLVWVPLQSQPENSRVEELHPETWLCEITIFVPKWILIDCITLKGPWSHRTWGFLWYRWVPPEGGEKTKAPSPRLQGCEELLRMTQGLGVGARHDLRQVREPRSSTHGYLCTWGPLAQVDMLKTWQKRCSRAQ